MTAPARISPLQQLIRRKQPSDDWWNTLCEQTELTYRDMLQHWEETNCLACMVPLRDALLLL